MDRQKYINSQDYRDGYDEGVEDGRKQIKKQIEYASDEIKKILSVFQNTESEQSDETPWYLKIFNQDILNEYQNRMCDATPEERQKEVPYNEQGSSIHNEVYKKESEEYGMTLRTKGEQKAYFDGFVTCAECIDNYLTNEGKRKLACMLKAVQNAVEIEDIEPRESGGKE